MFPNLIGQKAVHHLTDDDMSEIICTTRITYQRKLTTGKFTVAECKALCRHFNKPFDYLFATQDELPKLKGGTA